MTPVTPDTSTTTLPTIQTYGTHVTTLHALARTALNALEVALVTVQESAPHPRDYPNRDDWTRAAAEHAAHLAALHAAVAHYSRHTAHAYDAVCTYRSR